MTSVKVDAYKIREIARKLGVSEKTVEEYLLDRLTMQRDEETKAAPYSAAGGPDVIDRFGRPLEKEAG